MNADTSTDVDVDPDADANVDGERDVGPEAMFSLAGFAYALQRLEHRDVNDARSPLSFHIHLTGDVVVELTGDVLTCSDCGSFLSPPRSGWARWLAWNHEVHTRLGSDGSHCIDCMTDAIDRRNAPAAKTTAGP